MQKHILQVAGILLLVKTFTRIGFDDYLERASTKAENLILGQVQEAI